MAKRRNSENEMIVWKFGCNWGGRQYPSFYEFIEAEKVVIGRERCRYREGDLVLITDGYTVKAIAKVEEEPKPITSNPKYRILAEKFNVSWQAQTIVAKADWYELPEDKFFRYPVQKGAVQVHKPEIIEETFELWNTKK